MFPFTEVSLKDISKIIKGFKDMSYKSYVRKRSKHMPNDSYLYPSIQHEKFMMSYLRGLLRMQKKITQNISNSQGFSTDESK